MIISFESVRKYNLVEAKKTRKIMECNDGLIWNNQKLKELKSYLSSSFARRMLLLTAAKVEQERQ